MLVPPPLKSPPHVLADWAELKALSNPSGIFRLASLGRQWDVSRETEDSDPEGSVEQEADTDWEGVHGNDEDRFLDSVTEEIGERKEALGDSYPFTLDESLRLQVTGSPSPGAVTYIFCLLLTHANGKELLDGTWLPAVDNRVRDLFQACSTIAAAAEARGSAISFGWPRPNDNPPFLTRLREVYAEFGEGKVVGSPRPGVSPSPKDEEIDVIAWRPRPDRSPMTFYLLGQVASGDNWEGKPIAGRPIDNFHRNWFSEPPTSTPLAYIFIPHAVPPATQKGSRKERMAAIGYRYGTIIDRFRLPLLTQEGLDLANATGNKLTIERVDDLPSIQAWVIDQIMRIHEVSA